MNEMTENKAVAVLEPVTSGNGNGRRAMTATADLPIAKFVTNEQIIAEEKFLADRETEVEKRYTGTRGWLRIANVSAVIGKLGLYLYLDQLDTHIKGQHRQSEGRMRTAERLTRMAVYGEKLYRVRLWFFHQFLFVLRWFFIGGETNREANQQKQAVWLKDKLIELGPTFIKIGQSMGTRADLLPLPFVVALGE